MKISVTYILFTSLNSCFTQKVDNEVLNVSKSLCLFSKDLYMTIATQNKNLLFSPFSAHAILSLAYEGVGGHTKEILKNILRLPRVDIVRRDYQIILTHLTKSEDNVHLANRIYTADDYDVMAGFKNLSQFYFLSDIVTMNFHKVAEAAKHINHWIEENTNKKVKTLLGPKVLTQNEAMLLANVLYFKMNWLHEFSKDNTYDDTFYVSGTKAMSCEMMHQENVYHIGNTDNLDAQILRIRFLDRRFSMMILLPTSDTGLEKVENQLLHEDLGRLGSYLELKVVMLHLPKFKLDMAWELREPLQKMGFGDLFKKGADFSRMVNSPNLPVISHVIQKSFIDVAEKGIAVDSPSGAEIDDYDDLDSDYMLSDHFKVDHPFIYYIIFEPGKELNSTYILFMGKVVRPDSVKELSQNIKKIKFSNSSNSGKDTGPYVRSSQFPRKPLKRLLFLLYFIEMLCFRK